MTVRNFLVSMLPLLAFAGMPAVAGWWMGDPIRLTKAGGAPKYAGAPVWRQYKTSPGETMWGLCVVYSDGCKGDHWSKFRGSMWAENLALFPAKIKNWEDLKLDAGTTYLIPYRAEEGATVAAQSATAGDTLSLASLTALQQELASLRAEIRAITEESDMESLGAQVNELARQPYLQPGTPEFDALNLLILEIKAKGELILKKDLDAVRKDLLERAVAEAQQASSATLASLTDRIEVLEDEVKRQAAHDQAQDGLINNIAESVQTLKVVVTKPVAYGLVAEAFGAETAEQYSEYRWQVYGSLAVLALLLLLAILVSGRRRIERVREEALARQQVDQQRFKDLEDQVGQVHIRTARLEGFIAGATTAHQAYPYHRGGNVIHLGQERAA